MENHPTLDQYSENTVWKLLDFKAFETQNIYSTWFENATFSEVTYKLLLRRKPLFVLQNNIIPAVMLVIFFESIF